MVGLIDYELGTRVSACIAEVKHFPAAAAVEAKRWVTESGE
jgi:hypothetical protein